VDENCPITYLEKFQGAKSQKKRDGTTEGVSVLPIRTLCWILSGSSVLPKGGRKNRYGLSGLTAAVTGLTGCRHRSDRWRPALARGATVKGILLPPFLLSPLSFTILWLQTVNTFLPFTSLSTPSTPWRFEDSTKEKPQDWKQKDLPRPLFTFPFVFLGFNSSSSLQRYSKLSFARSPHLVQSFEFPLVEHLLRSPRRHSYRSIAFCWTHCEKSQIGVGRPSPVWPVAVTGLTGGACLPQTVFFFLFFNTYLF
jgi:hypothetical protein